MATYHLKTPLSEEDVTQLKIGDVVKVQVISVDLQKHRIGLTMKNIPKEEV